MATLSLFIVLTAPIMRPIELTPRQAIHYWAREYGVPEDLMLCLACRESNFDPLAVGAAGERGLFQFMPGTWAWQREKMGLDPDFDLAFDAWENARTAAYFLARGGLEHWATRGLCS